MMADLIDRAAAIKQLYDGFAEYWELPCMPRDIIIQRTVGDVRDEIKALPAVDAVPVVRCKDCKHMNIIGEGYRWCRAWERIQTMGDDGYCCFGERRGDNG